MARLRHYWAIDLVGGLFMSYGCISRIREMHLLPENNILCDCALSEKRSRFLQLSGKS